MSRWHDNIQRGTRASQPLATAVVTGALYGVSDEAGVVERSNGSAWQSYAAASHVIQVKNTETGAVATGTTQIPRDDTIPQNTEGDEYMTLAITPTSATNKLRIDVVVNLSVNANGRTMIAALFQDTTADALAVGSSRVEVSTATTEIVFSHYMTAGTTSATTFKVRAGCSDTGTTTFNGANGARLFGGVMASGITIAEIVP